MAADEKWYFTKEQLANTPSRKCGIDADKELSYRQQAANFIQDMGQRLAVTQLCINTAIVYMHRFYVFHSLSQFHRNAIATAALFLAAKVEEQPRKLEHVIKVAHICLHKDQTPPDVRSEQYLEQVQDVVFNENVLLQTLGFDVAIDHPHTHVVRCCHLVKASKDLAQASYFMASNSLHMTTMCLQYKPTVVACFCIHLACKWSNWEIPQSNEGKHWFWYVDRSVTAEQLQQLTAEFLHIFDNCPSRLKRRIKSISAKQSPSLNHPSLPNSPFDYEPRQVDPNDGGPTFQTTRPFPVEDPKKPPGQPSSSSSSSSRAPVDYREYREKKERERLEREKAAGITGVTNATGAPSENIAKTHHSHSHHAKQQVVGQSSTASSKHPAGPGAKLVSHHNHHAPHRNDGKPQQTSQRHSSVSASGQSARPRLPRDYNVPATSTNATYQHAHQTKDNANLGLIDPTTIPETSTQNPISLDANHSISEKSGNHIRPDMKHDKTSARGYDPRHKMPEVSIKDAEAKLYAKYQQEQQTQQRGRKIVDIVEQRSEEVRKLIEKPLPPPKASLRSDMPSQKDDYVGNMLKQSHNTKYGQEKMSTATPSVGNASRNAQDFGVVSGLGKSGTISKNSQQQHAISMTKFDSKSNVKNGNSQISGTNEEIKTEKRPRHQVEEDRLQGTILNQQQSSLSHGIPSQPVKHKSLFSPEKVTNPRESHARISRSGRLKTPPSTGNMTNVGNTGIPKVSKPNERVPDQAGIYDHPVQFESSQITVNNQSSHHHSSESSKSHGKRHRTSSVVDPSRQSIKQEPQAKLELSTKTESGMKMEQDENRENYETMKMLGRVPELIQPIRDNPTSANGRLGNVCSSASSLSNDLKPPELIKPFEPEPITRQVHLTNGLDMMIKRDDPTRVETDDSGLGCTLLSRSSQDYLSPMKSAQSISALLQEPLAPMPSLLQGMGDYHSQQTSSQQPQQDSQQHAARSYQYGENQEIGTRENRPSGGGNYQQTPQPMGTVVKIEKDVLSTVDISALAAPQQTIPESNPLASAQQTINPPQNPQNIVHTIPTSNEEPIGSCQNAPSTTHVTGTTGTTTVTTISRKSEHHKSDKKKKKKDRKHKEKDKPRDKRKHKHKDKEKEKHIKITIPKDKLNLANDPGALSSQSQIGNPSSVAASEKKSPQAGLKIKIPKERLKVTETTSQTVVQAPLKIKIRTSGGMGESTESSVSVSTSSSRKRDRSGMDTSNDTSLVAPPTKKQHPHHVQGMTTIAATTSASQIQGTTGTTGYVQQPQQQQQQHQQQQSSQQGQRQNGRHYSSNNKEKHSSSSHHKSSSKLSQHQQQQLLLQQQQQQQHHQHSHAT